MLRKLASIFMITVMFQTVAQADNVVLSGNITSNVTLTNSNTYLLQGFVYVKDGATLTIEPGTIIYGDKATNGSLIIEQGAKIMADGTADQPIVFTSGQPVGERFYGDWGGVIICGRAPANLPVLPAVIEGTVGSLYGGNVPTDNSGVLRYVRIEFPGIAFSPGNEINGLTLGGVGSGTTIEYVQVSYSGDDSFEWFGGTVNAKYLVALRGLDDDFDTDFGYSGKIQFAVSLRDPAQADASASHGFESDNDPTGSTNTPKTSPLFSNVTMVGPKVNNADVVNSNYRRALHLRRNTETSLYNSIVMGWPGAAAQSGIYIDANSTADNATNNILQIRNVILAGKDTVTTNATNGFDALAWFDTQAFGNDRFPTSQEVGLVDPFNLTNPNFSPNTGSAALSGADFTNARLTDAFFTPTSFRGAFASEADADRWDLGWTNYNPQGTSSGPVVVLSGNITTNMTLTHTHTYLLQGFVYVKDGATLTIEPGTVIYGDKATNGSLIIEQGAKIMADGTADQPIVFTSAQPVGERFYGDWGGIIICGRAPANLPVLPAVIEGTVGSLYGGNIPADNSGVLRYVRIEFPGIAFSPGNEINGLTLGGVGSGTTIEHVQVSYSGDDSFEWFGGTVNAKYLVALRGLDDDFDTDFGYSGKIQFAVSLRDPGQADASASHGFESDNDPTGSTNTPKTSPLFSNVTLVGPKVNNADVVNSNYRRALHLRRNTETSLYNSIVMGWPGAAAQSGIYIDANSTADNATNNLLQIRNVILAGKDTVTTNATNGFDPLAWFNTPAFGNNGYETSAEAGLVDPFNLTNPNFTPSAGSPALSGADFTNARLTDAFFTPTSYRGAFASEADADRWDREWANYNPQFATYSIISEVRRISQAVPTAYMLEQNYPNPFNPSTQIEYALAKPGQVTLKIYDVLGREVSTLVNENQIPGTYRATFNATGLATGIYFYRLNVSGYSEVKRMLFIK